MNKYFGNCKTIEDVKETFKKLAKQFHPDNGGDAEKFKAMMNEYTTAFNRLENVHRKANTASQADDEQEDEYTETPEQFAGIISKVVNLDGVEIEIVGHWVWLSGNTFAHKDTIKAAGFYWSKKHKKWYWNGGHKSKKHSRMSYSQIKQVYGFSKVKSGHTQARLATA